MATRPRHVRQVRFAELGEAGQSRIARAHVAVVGLGALGSVAAEALARAGVGKLTLIDRDFVEETNLPRQVLYTEEDAREGTPKAIAAERALRAIDSELELRAEVADLAPSSIDRILAGAQAVVDGTDNFSTRYLLNDWSLERGVPWVYGAAVGGSGLAMAVLPGDGPCLRCIFPEPTPPELTPTCETSGILGTVSGIVALCEATEALKIVSGRVDAVVRGLQQVEAWRGGTRIFAAERDPECPACARGERPYLRGERGDSSAVLCGRNSVQITPAKPLQLDLGAMAERMPGLQKRSPFLIRFVAEEHPVTLFADGRAIVGETTDAAVARTLYARYVGG